MREQIGEKLFTGGVSEPYEAIKVMSETETELEFMVPGGGDPRGTFYADPETLKQASGYYTFMNRLPLSSNMWIENCPTDHVPMMKVMLDPAANIEGIVGSESGVIGYPNYYPQTYKRWLNEPQLRKAWMTNCEFWFCSDCQSVWAIVQGFWTRVRINGLEQLSVEKVKDRQEVLKGEAAMAANELPDPGVKPSSDSTKCPNCHLWRTVTEWEPVPGEDTGKNIHTCPKCNTGDIVDRMVTEVQVGAETPTEDN